MWIRSTKAFSTHLNRFYLWKPCFEIKARMRCETGSPNFLVPELRVLALTKRHVGSGNEIDPG